MAALARTIDWREAAAASAADRRHRRTRRDRGTEDRHDRRAAVITAIAVTVDIVARRGAAGMSERPAQRVRQRCRFVDRRTTNHDESGNQAMVAAHAKEALRELLQTARGRNNQNH